MRRIIVTAADLGMCHATNVSIADLLTSGRVSGAALRVPCPWARDAAARHRGFDVGVSLTLCAEFLGYRWGPITRSPSLVDGSGAFPSTREDLWEHADPDEVRREARAQLERAIWWGFDVTHLDAHDDVMLLRPDLFDVFVEIALEFGLPVRLPSRHVAGRAGFPLAALAAEEGLTVVERVREPGPTAAGQGAPHWLDVVEAELSNLPEGTFELVLRPAVDTPELRAITASWSTRVDAHDVAASGTLDAALARAGWTRTSYRALRQNPTTLNTL